MASAAKKKLFLHQCIFTAIIASVFIFECYISLILSIKTEKSYNYYLEQQITTYQAKLTKLDKVKRARNDLILFLKALVKLQTQENQTIKIFNF